jgi:acetyl-CoA carboxylase biotin carboxyl carrier protein
MPAKNPRGGNGPDPPWDLKDIEKLIDLLTERQIEEFEMEKDGLRVRIRRGGASAGSRVSAPAHSPAAPPAPVTSRPATSASAAGLQAEPAAAATAAEAAPSEPAEALHVIKSPIVGTFYGAPNPTAPPFVKMGDVVEVGRVLCIIEAMKLMNEIECEVAGEIARVFVESGQPVEYGQPLFAVKPSQQK